MQNVATPGMALLGEAIVAPKEIMKYFGTGILQQQKNVTLLTMPLKWRYNGMHWQPAIQE